VSHENGETNHIELQEKPKEDPLNEIFEEHMENSDDIFSNDSDYDETLE